MLSVSSRAASYPSVPAQPKPRKSVSTVEFGGLLKLTVQKPQTGKQWWALILGAALAVGSGKSMNVLWGMNKSAQNDEQVLLDALAKTEQPVRRVFQITRGVIIPSDDNSLRRRETVRRLQLARATEALMLHSAPALSQVLGRPVEQKDISLVGGIFKSMTDEALEETQFFAQRLEDAETPEQFSHVLQEWAFNAPTDVFQSPEDREAVMERTALFYHTLQQLKEIRNLTGYGKGASAGLVLLGLVLAGAAITRRKPEPA